MSDVTPGLIPAPSPSVQAAPALPPIPADPAAFSAPLNVTVGNSSGSVSALIPTPVAAPAVVTAASTPGGNAGLSEYAGDFGASLSAILPPKVRLVLYPLGFLVSGAAVGAGLAHLIPLDTAALIAIASQAFTNGLAAGNVTKAR